MPLVSDEDLVKGCREGIQHLGCMVMIIQYKYQRDSDWICRQDGGPWIMVHYGVAVAQIFHFDYKNGMINN